MIDQLLFCSRGQSIPEDTSQVGVRIEDGSAVASNNPQKDEDSTQAKDTTTTIKTDDTTAAAAVAETNLDKLEKNLVKLEGSQDWREMWNPRMSMSFTSTKGLLNGPGDNNCFLNSAVQVWLIVNSGIFWVLKLFCFFEITLLFNIQG